MTDFKLPDRQCRWPYAIEGSKTEFDPAVIEEQALQILANAMTNNRLLAFVGAGASMAYGRMTWSEFTARAWDAYAERFDNNEIFKAVGHIWKTKTDYLEQKDHPLKLQILDEICNNVLNNKGKPGVNLKELTAKLLKDHHEFTDDIRRSFGIESSTQNTANATAEKHNNGLFELFKYISENRTNKNKAPNDNQFLAVLNNFLDTPSTTVFSPLRLLIKEWEIRRFLTTNYDSEIENQLNALNFHNKNTLQKEKPPAFELNSRAYQSFLFTPNNTAEALLFASASPKNSAEVMHIHGVATDMDSQVITEKDYQTIYLQDHTQRDLANNTARTIFSANPILFVGSRVNEDDVMRPMRQFMAGIPLPKRRKSVAIFTAIEAENERNFQKASLLAKYGVYTIHIGEAWAKNKHYPNWLYEFTLYIKAARTYIKDRNEENKKNAIKVYRKIPVGGLGFTENTYTHDREKLESLADTLKQIRGNIKPSSLIDADKKRWESILTCAESLAQTIFLCANLILIRGKIQQLIAANHIQPSEYSISRPEKAQKAARDFIYSITARHSANVERDNQPNRFRLNKFPETAIDKWTSFKKETDSVFVNAPQGEQPIAFSKIKGRRYIITTGPRGIGKGAHFDSIAQRPQDVLPYVFEALGYEKDTEHVVSHINLSFSNEFGVFVQQINNFLSRFIKAIDPSFRDNSINNSDYLEGLSRRLRRLLNLTLSKPDKIQRGLLILGHANALFDLDGNPKNGLIKRLIWMLLSHRYAAVPIDIIVYLSESHVNKVLRIGKRGQQRNSALIQANIANENPDPEINPDYIREWGTTDDLRSPRRMSRFNIRSEIQPNFLLNVPAMMIHSLTKTRVSDLVNNYFPKLSEISRNMPERSTIWKDIYIHTGGSRFAQTILLAFLDSTAKADDLLRRIEHALTNLNIPPTGNAVADVISYVLTQWNDIHSTREISDINIPESISDDSSEDPIPKLMHLFCIHGSPITWEFAMEILWHLSAFSHPVDAHVLLRCPKISARIPNILTEIYVDREGLTPFGLELNLIEAMLELLTHWCLVFRIEKRPAPPSFCEKDNRYRYSVHRHIQRHFLRITGGRNLETTQWDQFGLTLYQSHPDEVPNLDIRAQFKLLEALHSLTRYPRTKSSMPRVNDDIKSMWEDLVCLRAAFSLARSTYSGASISHLSVFESAPDGAHAFFGYFTRYRNAIRWILHAAKYWEVEYKNSIRTAWSAEGMPSNNKKYGVFYPGEMVWLFNECGVISLAQGKLRDAEIMFSQAEIAVRNMESEDTGPIHVRIRLNLAQVLIEQGQTDRARQILATISERRFGHPILPLVAKYLLGFIDHLGGNFASAQQKYIEALEGMRSHERSRAAAFVQMRLASLELRLVGGSFDNAIRKIEEAISLAQHGGHEDVRVRAVLAKVRICIEAEEFSGRNLFEDLDQAERYAVLMDMPRLQCELHELRARLLLAQGEYRISSAEAAKSLEIAAFRGLKMLKARALLTLALIYKRRGEVKGALTLVKRGKQMAENYSYYSCLRDFRALEAEISSAPPVYGRF